MSWLNRATHSDGMERKLDKELQFHIDQRVRDLIAQGHSPEEARRLARLEVGGPEEVKEVCRDARGTRWLHDFIQDARYTLRTLRLRPGFTAITLLMLALGIGASTVMFKLINGELEHFSMNSRRAPTRVCKAQLSNQIANLGSHFRASVAMAAFPCPVKLEAHSMPGDHRFGLHDEQGR